MIDFGFFALVIAIVIGMTAYITRRFFAPNPCDDCEVKTLIEDYWDDEEPVEIDWKKLEDMTFEDEEEKKSK